MNIGDFSSLYGASISVILVSGAIQELSRTRLTALDREFESCRQLRFALNLSQVESDYIDSILPDLEMDYDRELPKLLSHLDGLRVASWLGVGIPVICMFYGAVGSYDVGLFFILMSLAVCFGWGAIMYHFSRRSIDRLVLPLLKELKELKRWMVTPNNREGENAR
ncbi:hypothetical protein [Pelagibacterium sp. H642]|uniref:hypothetical protein n=1 Tax=Pelagibacterium sp. H642 TaxID=1881069 RepID=UPI002815AFBD|nr:hypothetical protein [Pelagibacterium sp. H642]WMT89721.1 hypothetical protein NO934_13075 [Pelagibacterium sp. H642]